MFASIANLIDHGILEEEESGFFVPNDEWKIDFAGWTLYHVEMQLDGTARITKEGKYDEPVIFDVDPKEEHSVELFKSVDVEF